MGDEEDRARLEGLSEKERETEIYKRIERRDVMRKRWEIERKLRQARKAERAKDKDYKPSVKKNNRDKKLKPITVAVEDLLVPMETAPPMAKSRPALPIEKKFDESGMIRFVKKNIYISTIVRLNILTLLLNASKTSQVLHVFCQGKVNVPKYKTVP